MQKSFKKYEALTVNQCKNKFIHYRQNLDKASYRHLQK